MPLDGDIDVDGLFDELESCVEGGSGMSGGAPASSIPDGTVDTVSG